jgi:hypothetical protein
MSLARVTDVQTYVNDMNRRVQEQLSISNPFEFKFIQSLKVCLAVCAYWS